MVAFVRKPWNSQAVVSNTASVRDFLFTSILVEISRLRKTNSTLD